MQYLIVLFLLCAAGLFIGRRILRFLRQPGQVGCGCGCSGCSLSRDCSEKNVHGQDSPPVPPPRC